MLFDFHLRPVNEITPWGCDTDLSLSWFALTDGFYRIEVGDDKLFTYSRSAVEKLSASHPAFCGEYVDYQVVRLWEDVLQILPDVFEPLPIELGCLLTGPEPSIKTWLDKIYEKQNAAGESAASDQIYNLCDLATSWLSPRYLDSMYLVGGPRIWIWSTPETVQITWDNREQMIEGVEAWSARCGSFSLTRQDFLNEVQNFDARLISQMEARVSDVCKNWQRPEVRIDFDTLRIEQLDRAKELTRSLERKPIVTNWDQVRDAVAAINQ